MRNYIAPLALLISVAALSGCAVGHGRSKSSRFVRPGEPTIDYGGPAVAKGDSLGEYIRKVQHLQTTAKASKSVMGTTIESNDRRLAAALLVESILPSAENHLQVADEYLRLGILDAAHARLNRAIAKEPRLARAHESMARVWRDWGFPELGLGSAYRATYFEPRSASAQNTLGTILDGMGRLTDARRAYERAASIDPTAGWALNNICYVEFRLGRFAEAQSTCKNAVELAPNLQAARNNLALAYAAAGDLTRAQEVFAEAGDSATAHYNLGIVHLAEREYASAADAFEQAIKERPDFTAAKQRAHKARVRALTGGGE